MADKQVLKALLSPKYDPAGESPSEFRQSYTHLVEHRNELRRKSEAEEQRWAEMEKSKTSSRIAPSEIPGYHFSTLIPHDDDFDNDDPTIPLPTSASKRNFTTALSDAQLDQLRNSERDSAVALIKSDIWILESEMKDRWSGSGEAGNSRDGGGG